MRAAPSHRRELYFLCVFAALGEAAAAKIRTAPPPNPYLDPNAVRVEQAYVRSVVERFKDVPWLSWDLINEPSFSNPRLDLPWQLAEWRP